MSGSMSRDEKFKRLDIKTRNRLKAILSISDDNTLANLAKLRLKLEKKQLNIFDDIIDSSYSTRAVRNQLPFPKKTPFFDTLQVYKDSGLHDLLNNIERNTCKYKVRLKKIASSLQKIDELYAAGDFNSCIEFIIDILNKNGWSHAVLRRIVLIRENQDKNHVDERIEKLLLEAGIKGVVVSSLIHSYARDQNILMNKRSVLNISDRGIINRYTRTLSKLSVQPSASSPEDLHNYLKEVMKCSLIDTIIFLKYNRQFFEIIDYPAISEVANALGRSELFSSLVETYGATDSEGEYAFFKQSSAWLEYEPIRQYRILIDNYLDSSSDQIPILPDNLKQLLKLWIGTTTLRELVGNTQFTKHNFLALSKLEIAGTVTRSALFNYWLIESEGQIGFDKEDLFTLMGLTRDLAKTIPIIPVRTAVKLAKDELVKLILLLLLAKRSKNELDNFHLRKLLEAITIKSHDCSLVNLVEAYEKSHPYIADYIYEIATEDFLAKLTSLAPHRADIPEIRASLHEWKARFSNEEYFHQRARAVRIDHQINRVRNEIDDHRIYVDPMRFTSWLEDEMMIELNSALTSTGSGKKGVSVTCDETVLSMIMKQSYSAFCSNVVFGIASYIGRRIRHGTFHGHMYSSVINDIERLEKFAPLFSNPQFSFKWNIWKDLYNDAVEKIISDRLHVHSKVKPMGLLMPDLYNQSKQDVIHAAVTTIINSFTELNSTSDVCPVIIDYCWRLAEIDLVSVIHFLKAQQIPLKNKIFLEQELVPTAALINQTIADTFQRYLERSIDRKLLTMLGWFKRPSIVAPKASVSLLFAATVAEIKDTIPDFDPQNADTSVEDIELVGNFYHLIYDSLAIVVGNAAKHSDRTCPVKRKFEIIYGKEKQLVIEICSSIKPTDDPCEVSRIIERRKQVRFDDANLYDKKSGISKLLLLASNRKDFELNQYEVKGREVHVRLIYALEH